jgi:hypothetical protein
MKETTADKLEVIYRSEIKLLRDTIADIAAQSEFVMMNSTNADLCKFAAVIKHKAVDALEKTA